MNIVEKLLQVQLSEAPVEEEVRYAYRFDGGETFKQLVIVLLIYQAVKGNLISKRTATKLWGEWFLETYGKDQPIKKVRKLWENRRKTIIDSGLEDFLEENKLEIIQVP